MKLELLIEGVPRINQSIHYTKKGIKYKPGTAIENDKCLRSSIVSRLPYEFKPFKGAVRVNKLNFVFPPAPSLTIKEKQYISQGGRINKVVKPDFIDCLESLFKAIQGIVLCNGSQICEITNVKKYYGAEPKIEIELEEIELPI